MISIAGMVILLVTLIVAATTKEGPDEEIGRARKKLTEAAMVKSAKYAREHYDRASQYYDSAMHAWTVENSRFILLRDFSHIVIYAQKSIENSETAISVARKYITRTEADLGSRIRVLEKMIYDFEKSYGDLPFSKSHIHQLSKSKLQLQEGILAFNNDNYSNSIQKLDSSEELIQQLFNIYQEKLEGYFSKYNDWGKWVSQAVAESKKKKSTCIVIDKVARVCLLYQNGRLLKTFDAELGPNWMGDKQQQGDQRTPEGSYTIIKKKKGSETRFYRALLLNYPNEEDKARFSDNKRKGIVSANARIGSLIEIHGKGGKGVDWTNGCIALNNDDMDELYRLCPVGTTVVIVGSTKPLNEVLQIRK
jgi:hypothetical protein